MAAKATSPIDAVRAIYEALEPLDDPSRERAIASAMSLLGMTAPSPGAGSVAPQSASSTDTSTKVPPSPTTQFERPVGLVEMIQERQPVTNAQRIALFAFYRERAEGEPRFSRHDLKGYFSEGRVPPPANYDRDFNNAVSEGWIHEDGDQSYLTTKGIEAVEGGFSGKRASPRSPRAKTSSKKQATRKTPSRKATKTAKTAKGAGRRKASTSGRKSSR